MRKIEEAKLPCMQLLESAILFSLWFAGHVIWAQLTMDREAVELAMKRLQEKFDWWTTLDENGVIKFASGHCDGWESQHEYLKAVVSKNSWWPGRVVDGITPNLRNVMKYAVSII